MYESHQNDSRVNDPSFSYFITILTLEDQNPKHLYMLNIMKLIYLSNSFF